ncbi:TPA: hypothetical protein ACJHMI_005195 [Bacillus cereus]
MGQKLMSLNAEKEFNENDIGPDKTPQQRVAEARAALKAQGLDDTYEAVRIPTEEKKQKNKRIQSKA